MESVYRLSAPSVPQYNIFAALATAGYPGVKESDLPRLLGEDVYEQELIVMAETSAYFHVAYKVSSQCSVLE